MTKKIAIVLFALGLCSCASTQLPPMDDAYYWPSSSVPTTQTTEPAQITQTTEPTSVTPTIEYLNIQDTTVTIRIKR